MIYALPNTHTLSTMASDFQREKSGILQKVNQNGLLLPIIEEIGKKSMGNDTTRKKSKCNSKDLITIRTPPPPSVARRNARERNRVKQVNNGFANLRQHIPNYIAAAFESNTGKGGNKKLSKVETLRMAVEYIRSLEKLLSLSDNPPATSVSYPSSTSSEIEHNINYANSIASPSSEDDNISSNSTPPPPPSLQYVRIIGSDAYHIVPSHVFESNERLKLLKVENDLITDSVLIDPDEEFEKVQLSSDINTNTGISPEMYSDSSLSPGVGNEIQGFIPVFNINEIAHQPIVKEKLESIKSNEEMRILCRNLIMLQAEADNTEKQTLNVNELMTW